MLLKKARRAIPRVIVLICGLLLSSCAQDSSLQPDANFSPVAQVDARQSLVLLGIRTVTEPVSQGWLFNGEKLDAYYDMRFNGIDPDNRLNDTNRRIRLCDRERVIFGDLFDHCEPTAMEYHLLQVPAGRYVLQDFTVHLNKISSATSFVAPVETILGMRRFSRPGDTDAAPPLSFSVNPGEIAYIGDFNWDVTNSPYRFFMTRNDQAASLALQKYPNVAAPLVFHAATVPETPIPGIEF